MHMQFSDNTESSNKAHNSLIKSVYAYKFGYAIRENTQTLNRSCCMQH